MAERPSDLLPCPFCGNDVSDDEGCFQSGGFTPASTPCWSVRCGNPSCNGETCGVSRAEAIAAWNRRTLDAAHINPPESDSKLIDAAPSEPVPSAECWRRACQEGLYPELLQRITKRAREIAREGK